MKLWVLCVLVEKCMKSPHDKTHSYSVIIVRGQVVGCVHACGKV